MGHYTSEHFLANFRTRVEYDLNHLPLRWRAYWKFLNSEPYAKTINAVGQKTYTTEFGDIVVGGMTVSIVSPSSGSYDLFSWGNWLKWVKHGSWVNSISGGVGYNNGMRWGSNGWEYWQNSGYSWDNWGELGRWLKLIKLGEWGDWGDVAGIRGNTTYSGNYTRGLVVVNENGFLYTSKNVSATDIDMGQNAWLAMNTGTFDVRLINPDISLYTYSVEYLSSPTQGYYTTNNLIPSIQGFGTDGKSTVYIKSFIREGSNYSIAFKNSVGADLSWIRRDAYKEYSISSEFGAVNDYLYLGKGSGYNRMIGLDLVLYFSVSFVNLDEIELSSGNTLNRLSSKPIISKVIGQNSILDISIK